jgi:hypothetical protein
MFKSAGKPLEFVLSPEEIIRFLGKVEVIDLPGTDSHGCWRWKGATVTDTEYGRVCIRNRYLRAHRVSFQVFVAPLDHDEDVHHRCRHEWCINPRHLEGIPHVVHAAISGRDSADGLVGVCYSGGVWDGMEHRFRPNEIPETFDVKSYGRVDTYRYSTELLEFVYDGYRKVKKRR